VSSRDEILASLKDVAVEVLGVEADAVVETASFKDDLEADSLDLVEVVMALEEKFDISIPEDDLADVATVGQAVDLVLDRVGAAA
jgi:acyl carrier protein